MSKGTTCQPALGGNHDHLKKSYFNTLKSIIHSKLSVKLLGLTLNIAVIYSNNNGSSGSVTRGTLTDISNNPTGLQFKVLCQVFLGLCPVNGDL